MYCLYRNTSFSRARRSVPTPGGRPSVELLLITVHYSVEPKMKTDTSIIRHEIPSVSFAASGYHNSIT